MRFRKQNLTKWAKLCLFFISYFPLFLILSLRQVHKYRNYLNWGGFSGDSVLRYIKLFGFVSILALITLVAFLGLYILIRNIHARTVTSGDVATIDDIENKNSESISYLFTYLIPFVFQDLSDTIGLISILILLLVTFLNYTNSSMLLINPTISMWYSLYEIKYTEEATKLTKKGFIMCSDKFVEERDRVKLKRMGHRLYYATVFNKIV